MVHIATRASWGALRADGDRNLSGLAVAVYAHHSVTADLPADATVAAEAAQMRVIESVGQSRFGTGISYNVIVFPSGRAYQGVSFNRRGTHTGGLNSTVRSICFAGNYENTAPTPAQLETAAQILAEGRGKWWTASAPLRGHRDQKSTACPGRHVYSALGALTVRAAALSGGAMPHSPATAVPVSAPAVPAPAPAPAAAGLEVDGRWGAGTTRALQRALGTPVDGVISHQWKSNANANITAMQFDRTKIGSALIQALQRKLGLPADGLCGADTISALQRHLGTPVDGVVSPVSTMVRELQRRLNAGTF